MVIAEGLDKEPLCRHSVAEPRKQAVVENVVVRFFPKLLQKSTDQLGAVNRVVICLAQCADEMNEVLTVLEHPR